VITTTVLISGASVAGTALAYWLGQHGYSVTVVERHPGLRPGGQAIDVRGPALAVLERMGLLAAAEDRTTRMRGASMVDRDGNELSRDTESTPTGGPIDNPDIELLFDDSIVTLANRGPAVDVTFERAAPRSFDLVIGADGLHSNVRGLVFGPEERFIKKLGTHAAIFTVPNFLDLDHWQTWHYGHATMAGVYSARNNTEALPRHRSPVRGGGTADGRRGLGTPATAAVHAVRAGFLLRRNVADRDGSLVNRQGGAGR
jgi:2-polyprenyl-6-methoxyphenol hydroxylase-like FAD-dependent oxidoreductase